MAGSGFSLAYFKLPFCRTGVSDFRLVLFLLFSLPPLSLFWGDTREIGVCWRGLPRKVAELRLITEMLCDRLVLRIIWVAGCEALVLFFTCSVAISPLLFSLRQLKLSYDLKEVRGSSNFFRYDLDRPKGSATSGFCAKRGVCSGYD